MSHKLKTVDLSTNGRFVSIATLAEIWHNFTFSSLIPYFFFTLFRLYIFRDEEFDPDIQPAFDYYDSSRNRVFIQTSIDNGAGSPLSLQAEECWATPTNDST
jgi:Zona pellucida-like domain